MRASVVVARGLSSCGSQDLERRLSSCGAWASLLRGMWDLPGPGLEPVSPALAGRFLTTALPGQPLPQHFEYLILVYFGCHYFYKKLALILNEIPICDVLFSLATFKILSSPLAFISLTTTCLGEMLFVFILLEIHCSSWTQKLKCFTKFDKISTIFFSTFFP